MLKQRELLVGMDDIWSHSHTSSAFIEQKMQTSEDTDHKKEKTAFSSLILSLFYVNINKTLLASGSFDTPFFEESRDWNFVLHSTHLQITTTSTILIVLAITL